MDNKADEILRKLNDLQKRIEDIEGAMGIEKKVAPLTPPPPPIIKSAEQPTEPETPIVQPADTIEDQPSQVYDTPPKATAKPEVPPAISWNCIKSDRSQTQADKSPQPEQQPPASEPEHSAEKQPEVPAQKTEQPTEQTHYVNYTKTPPVVEQIEKPSTSTSKVEPKPETKSHTYTPAELSMQKTPPAIETAKTKEAKPAAPKKSLEQVIGQKWMLFVGLAAILAGGVYFFKFAYDQGWINPLMRCVSGTIFASALLVVGEIAHRKTYKLHAAGLFAAGIVWLYYTAWAVSPNGWYADYNILTATQAFGGMILVTAVGVFLSLRANLISNAIITIIGALATPLLLSSGQNHQVALMTYLAAVNIAFLAVAWKKNWLPVATIAMAGTLAIIGGWMIKYLNHPNSTSGWLTFFTWLYWALFTGFFTTYRKPKRILKIFTVVFTFTATLAIYFNAAEYYNNTTGILAQIFILSAAMLVIARLRRWNFLRVVMLIWVQTLWLIGSAWLDESLDSFLNYCAFYAWTWMFGTLFLGDVFYSVLREQKNLKTPKIEFFNSIVTIVTLYTAVFNLYDYVCYTGLGVTTAGMGILALLGAAIIYRKSKAEFGDIYLIAGLSLLGIAVPLMFNLFYCTIAWIILGAAIFTASRMFKRVIMVLAPTGMVLVAWGHFVLYMLNYAQQEMNEVIVVFNCCELKASLFTAWGIAAAMLACATAMLWFKAEKNKKLEFALSCLTLLLGTATACYFAVIQMSKFDSTGFALLLACLITGISFCRPRLVYFRLVGISLATLATLKWIIFDVLISQGFFTDTQSTLWLGLNQQFITALALAGGLFWINLQVKAAYGQSIFNKLTFSLAPILALLTITLAGNHEVTRYIQTPIHKQLALTIWWASWAILLTLISFPVKRPSCRFITPALFAIALLGVTAVKWIFGDVLENYGYFCSSNKNWWWLGLNPQFIACIIISIGVIWAGIKARMAFAEKFENRYLFFIAPITALLVLTLGGNHEVTRLITGGMNKQMALDIWWACWAIILLVMSFPIKKPACRFPVVGTYAIALLCVAGAKWAFGDVIEHYGFYCKANTNGWWLGLNPQFIACVLISAGLLWGGMKARMALSVKELKHSLYLLTVAALFLLTLGGNHEVTRFIESASNKAMAVTIWWACWANLLLLISFRIKKTAPRFPVAGLYAFALIALAAVKWTLFDVMEDQGYYCQNNNGQWLIFNPQFVACILISAGLLWAGFKARLAFAVKEEIKNLFNLTALGALLVLTLGGNHEVTRLIESESNKAIAVTIWWAVFSNLLILIGFKLKTVGYRFKIAAGYGTVLLGVAALRWTFGDVLFANGWYCKQNDGWWVILNPQFIACIILAVGLVWAGIKAKANLAYRFESQKIFFLAPLAMMIIITLGGNYEVTRLVATDTAKQMALSLWWAIWATTMLITGFKLARPGYRYFAIVLYCVTIIKVLLHDMRGVNTVYRVLTFIGLGLLLVACSWLYHKYLKDTIQELTSDNEE